MAKDPILVVQKGDFYEQKYLSEQDIPVEERLEKRAETLAEKLLDDAEQVLNDPDQEKYDGKGNLVMDTTSRRKYVLAVMQHVAKMVQGKQGIKLKKGEEARNNASFLMDLLKKAQSGRMSTAELQALTPKKPDEQIIESV